METHGGTTKMVCGVDDYGVVSVRGGVTQRVRLPNTCDTSCIVGPWSM